MEKNNSVKITGIIVVGFIVLASIFYFASSNFSPSREVINVNGVSKLSVVPDLITVYFNVDVIGDTAVQARDKNSEKTDALISSLESLGLSKSDISTQSFNVYENYEWTGTRSIQKGYRATHNVKVVLTSENADLVGKVIDAGIDSGALLSYINYELSQELENQYKAEALKLATADARNKAEAMAEGLGAKLGKVVSVSNNEINYYPWRAYDMALSSESMAKGSAIETQIIVGEQEISGLVSVTYQLR